jgi:glycosyltransferase involved in cell wall biosynthesis
MSQPPAPSDDPPRFAEPLPPASEDALAGRTVLQIIPALDEGGAERTTIDIAAALTQAGARALVATEGGRLIGELQAQGGLWIPFAASTKNPLRILSNAARLRSLVAREKIDLIHARSRAPAWSAHLATKKLKMPFVTTYHGAYSGKSQLKRKYNSVMVSGDAVIANSWFTATSIASIWPEVAPRLHVIHRGTNLSAFTPAAVAVERVEALRRAWDVAPHQRIVLLPGRLTPWKGQRVLIEAAATVRQNGIDDVVFILAGDHQGREAYAAELKARAAELGLADYVRQVGHCGDMPAAYLSAAVVAIPSTGPEAFGRTAVEAQAMGCPVIVSDHGATSETVLAPPETPAARRTGWRVTAGDAAALALALQEALGLGASAHDALAAKSRAHVEAHFSLEAMCRATLAIYAHLLARPPATI